MDHNISEHLTVHVVTRCSNNEFLLKEAEDFIRYKEILVMAMKKYSFETNNYTLMNNHSHLILTVKNGNGLDVVMRWFNGIYSKDYNRRHKRYSHFWRARYKSRIIGDERYALGCLRYQHRNPLRAGMVNDPIYWPWSSYKFYAWGEEDALITPHPAYLTLSNDPRRRQKIYREFVATQMPFDDREKKFYWGSGRGRPAKRKDPILENVLPLIGLACSKS